MVISCFRVPSTVPDYVIRYPFYIICFIYARKEKGNGLPSFIVSPRPSEAHITGLPSHRRAAFPTRLGHRCAHGKAQGAAAAAASRSLLEVQKLCPRYRPTESSLFFNKIPSDSYAHKRPRSIGLKHSLSKKKKVFLLILFSLCPGSPGHAEPASGPTTLLCMPFIESTPLGTQIHLVNNLGFTFTPTCISSSTLSALPGVGEPPLP